MLRAGWRSPRVSPRRAPESSVAFCSLPPLPESLACARCLGESAALRGGWFVGSEHQPLLNTEERCLRRQQRCVCVCKKPCVRSPERRFRRAFHTSPHTCCDSLATDPAAAQMRSHRLICPRLTSLAMLAALPSAENVGCPPHSPTHGLARVWAKCLHCLKRSLPRGQGGSLGRARRRCALGRVRKVHGDTQPGPGALHGGASAALHAQGYGRRCRGVWQPRQMQYRAPAPVRQARGNLAVGPPLLP